MHLVACWIIHLLVNMISLILIGVRLEQQFGFGMFCLLPLLHLTAFHTVLFIEFYGLHLEVDASVGGVTMY